MICGDTLLHVDMYIDAKWAGEARMVADKLTTLNQVVIGVGSYAKQTAVKGSENLQHGVLTVSLKKIETPFDVIYKVQKSKTSMTNGVIIGLFSSIKMTGQENVRCLTSCTRRDEKNGRKRK